MPGTVSSIDNVTRVSSASAAWLSLGITADGAVKVVGLSATQGVVFYNTSGTDCWARLLSVDVTGTAPNSVTVGPAVFVGSFSPDNAIRLNDTHAVVVGNDYTGSGTPSVHVGVATATPTTVMTVTMAAASGWFPAHLARLDDTHVLLSYNNGSSACAVGLRWNGSALVMPTGVFAVGTQASFGNRVAAARVNSDGTFAYYFSANFDFAINVVGLKWDTTADTIVQLASAVQLPDHTWPSETNYVESILPHPSWREDEVWTLEAIASGRAFDMVHKFVAGAIQLPLSAQLQFGSRTGWPGLPGGHTAPVGRYVAEVQNSGVNSVIDCVYVEDDGTQSYPDSWLSLTSVPGTSVYNTLSTSDLDGTYFLHVQANTSGAVYLALIRFNGALPPPPPPPPPDPEPATIWVLADPSDPLYASSAYIYSYDDNLDAKGDNVERDPTWVTDFIEGSEGPGNGIRLFGDEQLTVIDSYNLYIVSRDTLLETDKIPVLDSGGINFFGGSGNGITQQLVATPTHLYGLTYADDPEWPTTRTQITEFTIDGVITRTLSMPENVNVYTFSTGLVLGLSLDQTRLFVIAWDADDEYAQHLWEVDIESETAEHLFSIPSVDSQINPGDVTWGSALLVTATGIIETSTGGFYICGTNATIAHVNRGGNLLDLVVCAHEDIGGSLYGMVGQGSTAWAAGNDGLYKIDLANDVLIRWVDLPGSGLICRVTPPAPPGFLAAENLGVRLPDEPLVIKMPTVTAVLS